MIPNTCIKSLFNPYAEFHAKVNRSPKENSAIIIAMYFLFISFPLNQCVTIARPKIQNGDMWSVENGNIFMPGRSQVKPRRSPTTKYALCLSSKNLAIAGAIQ